MSVKGVRGPTGDSHVTNLLIPFQFQFWKVELNDTVLKSYQDSVSLHTNPKIISYNL